MKKIIIITACCLMGSVNAAQTCYADVTATAPASHFTINADNTVTDNTTGLTWMRCSLGQTGSDCSGGAEATYTWAEALNEVANNYSGWRVPNINELLSIVELKCSNPAINLTIFPNTSTLNGGYWSSSPHAEDKYDAWAIYFLHGYAEKSNKTHTYKRVRLVRGGL